MTGPLVTVVIPTRRRPELVQRALRSVLAQTHTALDVVVVIDGPDPATAEALRNWPDERMRVLQNPAPIGAGAARNRAALEAKGAWIAFLDDDDEWLPDKLARQLAAAAGRGGAGHLSVPGAHARRRGAVAADAVREPGSGGRIPIRPAHPVPGGRACRHLDRAATHTSVRADPVQHGPAERGHDPAAARHQAGGGGRGHGAGAAGGALQGGGAGVARRPVRLAGDAALGGRHGRVGDPAGL